MKIDFYVLPEQGLQAEWSFACKLIVKAYDMRQQVYVFCNCGYAICNYRKCNKINVLQAIWKSQVIVLVSYIIELWASKKNDGLREPKG